MLVIIDESSIKESIKELVKNGLMELIIREDLMEWV